MYYIVFNSNHSNIRHNTWSI